MPSNKVKMNRPIRTPHIENAIDLSNVRDRFQVDLDDTRCSFKIISFTKFDINTHCDKDRLGFHLTDKYGDFYVLLLEIINLGNRTHCGGIINNMYLIDNDGYSFEPIEENNVEFESEFSNKYNINRDWHLNQLQKNIRADVFYLPKDAPINYMLTVKKAFYYPSIGFESATIAVSNNLACIANDQDDVGTKVKLIDVVNSKTWCKVYDFSDVSSDQFDFKITSLDYIDRSLFSAAKDIDSIFDMDAGKLCVLKIDLVCTSKSPMHIINLDIMLTNESGIKLTPIFDDFLSFLYDEKAIFARYRHLFHFDGCTEFMPKIKYTGGLLFYISNSFGDCYLSHNYKNIIEL